MRFRGVLKERKPSSQTETELKRQDMTSNRVALVTGAKKPFVGQSHSEAPPPGDGKMVPG
jgi:hypothetical protein